MSQGPQLGQVLQGSTNMFRNTLRIDQVSPIDPMVECVASIDTSTMMTSVTLVVTGKLSGDDTISLITNNYNGIQYVRDVNLWCLQLVSMY